MRRARRASSAFALLAVAASLRALPAAAHPGPGAPPVFVTSDCIDVIDKRESPELVLEYHVDFDDTTFGVGEIQLPDSKTHRFFAFTGSVVKTPGGSGYQLYPFDPEVEQALEMPLWLDQDDVDRAEGAAGPIDMTNFTADQVAEADVLANRPDVMPYLLPFGPDTAQFVITEEQARMGAHWDLTAVPAGVYQVGGYVFSPPFNDWALRSSLIRVVDGETAVPAAAVIAPIDGFVFAGQGRKVHGCVSAPPGSTLSAWVRAEEQPGSEWEPLASDQAIEGDAFELCWPNPAPGRSAVVRVRVVVTTPDGQRTAAYSPDTLSSFDTAAACVESESLCCPPGEPPAEPADGGGMQQAGSGSAAGGSSGAAGEQGAAPPPPDMTGAPGDGAEPPEQPAGTAVGATKPSESEEGGGGGCAAVRRRPGRSDVWLSSAVLAPWWLRRRRACARAGLRQPPASRRSHDQRT